ncbi:MAG TPA: hypothetical protein VIG72_00600 [Pontibacter sp.]
MPFDVYYESDFYRIEADVKGNLIRSQWLRHVTENELIAGATKLYEALRDTRIERAVANGQALGAISPGAKDWMASKFYELLSGTNLKKLARIMPASVFHQLALESVVTRAEAMGKTNYQVKNFPSQQAALDWLMA